MSTDTMEVWDRLATLAWNRGAFVLLTPEGVETALRDMPEIAAEAVEVGYPETLSVEEIARRAERSYYEFAALSND
jgi:hypothetical protein